MKRKKKFSAIALCVAPMDELSGLFFKKKNKHDRPSTRAAHDAITSDRMCEENFILLNIMVISFLNCFVMLRMGALHI